MRPLLTVLLVVLIMTLVAAFQRFQQEVRRMHRPAAMERVDAERPVRLTVIATCDLRPDAFQAVDPCCIQASLDGERWRGVRANPLLAGETWRATIDQGLLLGVNEVFVRLNPALQRASPVAAKVTVSQGNRILGESLLFADQPGVPLAGVLSFVLEDSAIQASQHGLLAPSRGRFLASNPRKETRVMNDATKSQPAVEVSHLTVSYGPRPALLDVSFSIPKGRLVGVIGPNGSGKSTLIKAILGFVKPDHGQVKLFGELADRVKGRVAYVPQRGSVDWDFPVTVREVAVMGRYGHRPWWRDLTRKDYQLAEEALAMVRMQDFGERQIGQLSGGQQQRVFMARAMAQGAEILLLDEPFAGVDAATERAILDVLDKTRAAGRTLVVVHHDLATAAEYFDSLLLLKQRLYAYGSPERVLHPELLSEVYEGKLRIFAELSGDLSLREKAALERDVRSESGADQSHGTSGEA